MKITNKKFYLMIAVLLFSFAASVLWAQEVGETVILRGIVDDDLYAAGRIVDIQAEVRGDVVVAEVDLDEQVNWEFLGDFKSRISRERPINQPRKEHR